LWNPFIARLVNRLASQKVDRPARYFPRPQREFSSPSDFSIAARNALGGQSNGRNQAVKMERQNYQFHFSIDWSRLTNRLIYLPGAVILSYGFWLTLTA
jgi:hypothetical protein